MLNNLLAGLNWKYTFKVVMKTCAIKMGLQFAALAMLILFIVGFVWSVVPIGGGTLPHWVEVLSGFSFSVAALLVSVLLGVVVVISMSAAYVEREFDWCGKKDDES